MKTDTCVGIAADEPLLGSAPFNRVWLTVDCPKPRNGKIQKSTGFPAIGAETADALMSCRGVGPMGLLGRTGVISEPSLTCYAWSEPGEASLGLDHVGWVEVHIPLDRTDLLAALGQADWSQLDFRPATPALYVCTHGSRDSCCGRLGVPILQAFREQGFPGPIYDCSHLGGHRFAATLLSFPQGRCYGRVDAADVAELRSALTGGAGDELKWLRGQCAYEPALQLIDAEMKFVEDSFPASVHCLSRATTSTGYEVTFIAENWGGTASFTEETVTSIQSCADIPTGQAKSSKRTLLHKLTAK